MKEKKYRLRTNAALLADMHPEELTLTVDGHLIVMGNDTMSRTEFTEKELETIGAKFPGLARCFYLEELK